MSFQRVKIVVDANWAVVASLEVAPMVPMVPGAPVAPVAPANRVMESASAKEAFPLPPAAERTIQLLDAPVYESTLSRIRKRLTQGDDVKAFGEHLFLALIGKELWSNILMATAGSPGVELALVFPPASPGFPDLSNLHWEMMYHDGFLVRGTQRKGKLVRIAITRLVKDITAVPGPLSLPPRWLFVVGADLDDPKIKPGAECMSMLRRLRHISTKRTFHSKILLDASPTTTQDAIRSFEPDIVHFICHGTRSGQLEFKPDPSDPPGTADKRLNPKDVCDLFTKANSKGEIWRPSVVLLSACDSGLSLGAESTAPLAADLVRFGIPIVVGMAGRVSDIACRLFSRGFAEALCMGHPLVDAMEMARRASFMNGEPAGTTCDWALPTLYLPENGVNSDFAPTARKTADKEVRIATLINHFRGANEHPRLAARVRELETAYSMLSSGQLGGMPVGFILFKGEAGTGKTRLLQELVELSVQEGSVPVLVSVSSRNSNISPPANKVEFADVVGKSLRNTLRFYQGIRANKFKTELLSKENLNFSAEEFVDALRSDLSELFSAAQLANPLLVSDAGRPVLFLDDLETLGLEFLLELFSNYVELIGPNGLASPGQARLPVVGAFRISGPTQIIYEQAFVKLKNWAQKIEICPFTATEDVGAYQHVLLNPHSPTAFPGISEKSWVIRGQWQPESQEFQYYISNLRMLMRRVPSDFDGRDLYTWVSMSRLPGKEFLEIAEDAEILKKAFIEG